MYEIKIKSIVIFLMIIMIVIISVGITLYVTTDVFKSDEELFKKYISQDLENIMDVFDISDEEEIIDIIQSNDYINQTKVKLNYLENENDQEEIYTISEDGTINNSEEKSYKNIEITYNDEILSKIELLQEQDLYGFRLSNLVQQFVTMRNDNMDYFISSMGYNGQYFSDILHRVDLSGLFQFSDEDIQNITNTYAKIIFSDISAKSYSSKRNALITLNNGQSVETNSYSLTITKNELDKIYKRILNQVESDNLILSKLDELDNKLEEFGVLLPEGESIHEKFVDKVQEISNKIEYAGEDTRQIIFTVYEVDGVTVRTSIKTETKEFLIDLDETSGKTLSLKATELTDDGTDTKIYSLGRMSNGTERIRTVTYNDSVRNLELTINTTKNEEQIDMYTNFDYNDEKISMLNIEAETKIDLSSNSVISVTFEDGKNYILNDYEASRVIDILKSLKDIFINSLEEKQSKINTKLLNNILIWIDQKEQEQANKEQNDKELQKQRFNNQFILYAGENLKYEHVQKLLEVVSKNMSDYHVVSGTQIQILIEDGKENTEKAEEIKSQLDDKHTYNIDINYDEDGYINSIDLSVYEKDKNN